MNSGDFDRWHELSIRLLEQPNSRQLWQEYIHAAENLSPTSDDLDPRRVVVLRESFDAVLRRYTQLHKYWLAYAKWELSLRNTERFWSLLAKGSRFCQHNINYWVASLKLRITMLSGDTEALLRLFEIARRRIGFNYFSFEFYDLYLQFLSTYATHLNDYLNKRVVLIRLLQELPIYDMASTHKELLKFINSPELTNDHLSHFMHDVPSKKSKSARKHHKARAAEDVMNFFLNSYIVNQFRSHELYHFEQQIIQLINTRGAVSTLEHTKVWQRYLAFAELAYESAFVIQLYDRCIGSNAASEATLLHYVDYLFSIGMTNKARAATKYYMTCYSVHLTDQILLHLINIELRLNNVRRAKDMAIKLIALNDTINEAIIQKLFEIEHLEHTIDSK